MDNIQFCKLMFLNYWVFCPFFVVFSCFFNFLESSGKTLKSQSWLLEWAEKEEICSRQCVKGEICTLQLILFPGLGKERVPKISDSFLDIKCVSFSFINNCLSHCSKHIFQQLHTVLVIYCTVFKTSAL